MSTADELMAVIRMYAKNPTPHNEFKVRATLTDFLPYAAQEPDPPASGCLPPLPEPCNKGQSLVGGVEKPWEPLFDRHQMREYARRTVYEQQDAQEPPVGLHALRDAVRSLRETGRFVDDEGEATNALGDLADRLGG